MRNDSCKSENTPKERSTVVLCVDPIGEFKKKKTFNNRQV